MIPFIDFDGFDDGTSEVGREMVFTDCSTLERLVVAFIPHVVTSDLLT